MTNKKFERATQTKEPLTAGEVLAVLMIVIGIPLILFFAGAHVDVSPELLDMLGVN